MSQQLQQPQTGQQLQQPQTGQQLQQPQTGQQLQQTFEQYMPQRVSQAVYQLEQIESDAEWAHGKAMQMGDSFGATKLADIVDLVHLQKKLLLRGSDSAPIVSQCATQALQQCSQQLQQSQTPGAQQVARSVQSISREITQVSSQAGQIGQGQQMGGQSQMGQSIQPGTSQRF